MHEFPQAEPLRQTLQHSERGMHSARGSAWASTKEGGSAAATGVVHAASLDEASAKVRTGPPVDDDADYALDVWAGVVPLALRRGELEADPART